MKRIIKRRIYNTETAERIASDAWSDGSNLDRGGRNTYLYRTKNGAYFVVTTTMWQGEDLYPISQDRAIDLYEGELRHAQDEPFEEAFPGVEVEEA